MSGVKPFREVLRELYLLCCERKGWDPERSVTKFAAEGQLTQATIDRVFRGKRTGLSVENIDILLEGLYDGGSEEGVITADEKEDWKDKLHLAHLFELSFNNLKRINPKIEEMPEEAQQSLENTLRFIYDVTRTDWGFVIISNAALNQWRLEPTERSVWTAAKNIKDALTQRLSGKRATTNKIVSTHGTLVVLLQRPNNAAATGNKRVVVSRPSTDFKTEMVEDHGMVLFNLPPDTYNVSVLGEERTVTVKTGEIATIAFRLGGIFLTCKDVDGNPLPSGMVMVHKDILGVGTASEYYSYKVLPRGSEEISDEDIKEGTAYIDVFAGKDVYVLFCWDRKRGFSKIVDEIEVHEGQVTHLDVAIDQGLNP